VTQPKAALSESANLALNIQSKAFNHKAELARHPTQDLDERFQLLVSPVHAVA